jgi:ubiquinone/menaquinone biosynthesis C-methylase UbiE
VLEIGAGYGRTAFALLALFPEASYTIVDIPPALDISRWYLEALYPDRDLAFVDAGDSERLPDAGFDLALSISSLQEMLPAEIERYLRLVDRTTRAGIVYLKQRAEWHNPDDRLTTRFDDYPIPERWRLLDRRAAPVQTSFTEAAWEIP